MSTETLPEVTAPEPTGRRGGTRPLVTLMITLLLVGLVGGAALLAGWPQHKEDVRAGTTLVTAEGMAAQTGIDVNLIAVTAAGGLIEFRYQVVDPDKADQMIHETDLLPVLVVEETGETLVVATPHHHTDLQLGGTYYFLLANAHNVLRDGSLVTLVMGDARLEHLRVRG
ncbi:hypothetical protein OEB99_19695 [Actinotalea sp. M2MS4P-6]|uniref:hypothetical protein n=1 Tax=Actinotalea sp. M2MS4P-6 TaxID=2983762 RepID=UPI0021E4009A|nr:hypothetical protein [Actinotalea sp. M2MS4P-6]MCV2396540.1 hypothetical protein [Actinotalea sp. M2MS4P-6]